MTQKFFFLLRREAKTPWVLKNPEGWLISESKTGVVTGNWMVVSFVPFIKAQIPVTDVPLIIMDAASGHIHSIQVFKTETGV